MVKPKEVIIRKIKEYIDMAGGDYSNWYVGIATDPQKRLYEDHNVDRNGLCTWEEAEDSNIAREIEKYLIEILGTDGGISGGDNTTKFVYTYKKTTTTREG